jgi:hypothetical protein
MIEPNRLLSAAIASSENEPYPAITSSVAENRQPAIPFPRFIDSPHPFLS